MLCKKQALREQIENYNKQIGIVQERIKMIHQSRIPDKDPYKATVIPLPMSGVLPPPPKIYIPPEAPPSPVTRHRPVSKERVVIREKHIKKPQSPIDPKLSYAAALTSGRSSPMISSRESSPFARSFTPSRSSPRTDLFESYMKKEQIMSTSQTGQKSVTSRPASSPSPKPVSETKEKHKKQEAFTSTESKSIPPSEASTKIKVEEFCSEICEEKDVQKSTVSDSSASVEGTSWASGFLSKPSYADILSGRASPLPHSASPEFPDNSYVTSSYQKEVVGTEESEDTTEKVESSAFRSSSYTETAEPVVDLPESPDYIRCKPVKAKKMTTVPTVGHFVRGASPKFFDLKTRTPSPSSLKEFSESRVSSTSVSKTVVFSEGERHVTQTESSHSQIETKSFCASPGESRKLTYAQVARISSPVDGSRSASPRQPPSRPHSQASQHKSDSAKPPDASKSDSDQKSFLEVNSDNRNRPKLDQTKEADESKQTEQNQKNLIRPLLSIEEGALNVHLLSRGSNYHHPLFCEIFQISQESENEALQHMYCVFGISRASCEASLLEAMSLFSNIDTGSKTLFLSSGQIKLSSCHCAHIEQWFGKQQSKDISLCFDCRCLCVDSLSDCETKLSLFSNYNYWDALAHCILSALKCKYFVAYSSSNFFHTFSQNGSIKGTSFNKGHFITVPINSYLLRCMFYPINKNKRKPKIKLLQNFSPDAIIVTDNVKYLCIPLEIKFDKNVNKEEEESHATGTLHMDQSRKILKVSNLSYRLVV